jgi:hypothetical protein
MTLQNPNPHIAGRLVAVDEQNFLVRKDWLAAKRWWAIQTPPPKGEAQLGRIVLLQEEGVKEMERALGNWQGQSRKRRVRVCDENRPSAQ